MLKERIDILQQASIISQIVGDFVKQVIDDVGTQFTQNESGMEMFTTHLAMATQRINNDEPVENLDDMIWNEVLASPYYEQAIELFKKIQSIAPCVYPEGEQRFIIMHLCNLHQI